MKKSKTIYLFNIIIIIFTYIYVKNYKLESFYTNETKVIGIVEKVKIKDGNVTLFIKAKEKILAQCYECTFLYKVGDQVALDGYFKEIVVNNNFYLFDYKEYLLSLKITKNFIFKEVEFINSSNNIITKTYNILSNRISNLKSSDFLKAMVLGDTSLFSDEINESYKKNGIVHLFAISGMHVNILATFLLLVLNKINKWKFLNYLIVIIFLIMYMLLINSPSIIRSVLMFISFSITKMFKLKMSSKTILFYICVINLIINPYNIYSLGFKLSYIVSFGLLLASEYLKKYKNYISKMFNTSLISFLVSLPLIVNTNFEINLLTPVLNVLIIPIVSIVLFPIAILTMIFPVFDNILVFLLIGFNSFNIFLSNISLSINIPYMNLLLTITFYTFFIGFIKNYKCIYLIIVLLIFLINRQYFINDPFLTMIDVGQGDSILISYPHNQKNILIDAGGNRSVGENIIGPFLKSIGISKIDHLIITHGDVDHTSGVVFLIKNFEIKNIYLNNSKNSLEEEKITQYADNYMYVMTEKEIEDNIAIYNFDSDDENKNSLITYFSDYKILLMGDASIEEEEKIISKVERADILKVGHHGSKTSTSENFLQRMNPKISLISVALNNRYHHPDKLVLERLKGTQVLQTSINGMIKINLKTLEYETCL